MSSAPKRSTGTLVAILGMIAVCSGAIAARTSTGGRALHELSRRPFSQWAAYGWERVAHKGVDFAIVRLVIVVALGALAVWVIVHADRVRDMLRRFFAETASPIDLAVFRIVLFSALLLTVRPAQIDECAGMPPELRTPPAGFALLVRVVPITPQLANGAARLLQVACVLAIIGLFSRTCAFTAGLLAIYVLGISHSCGRVSHNHYLVWFPLVLAFSRCGDALSVDSAWRRWRRREPPPAPSAIYARPIRWIWLLMGVIYFFPGFWKLWISGPDWLFGDGLIARMHAKWHRLEWISALRVDHWPWLARLSGIGAVAFEVSFLPLVLNRRTRPFAAAFGFLFHGFVMLLMDINFLALQACYVTFLPIGRLASRWVRSSRAAPENGIAARLGRPWALDGVVGLLLVANAWAGILMIPLAWPIACFPMFATTPKSTVTDLQFTAVSASGSERPIALDPLRREYGNQRWSPIMDSARESPEGLAALARLIASRTPESRGAVGIAIYRVTLSIDPDSRAGPLSRELLTTVALREGADPAVRVPADSAPPE